MDFLGRGGKVSGCGCGCDDEVHVDGDVNGHDDVYVRGEMVSYYEMRLHIGIRLGLGLDYVIFCPRFVSWSS